MTGTPQHSLHATVSRSAAMWRVACKLNPCTLALRMGDERFLSNVFKRFLFLLRFLTFFWTFFTSMVTRTFLSTTLPTLLICYIVLHFISTSNTCIMRLLAYRQHSLICFKLAVLAYKALHDWVPSYLAEDCQLVAVTGRRRLRSSHIDACQVRRTNTRFGDCSFAAAGPRTWNSLPIQLRDSELSLGQFRRSLKTHLYKHIFRYWQLQRRVTVFFMRWAQIDLLTYLFYSDFCST